MTDNQAALTAEEFEYIVRNPGVTFPNETGSCTVHYASGDREFVMIGPTGVHSLYADATDRNRLNAHWLVFSAN
jgi:hypothetical protein